MTELLARSSDDTTIKIILAVIAVIIWAVSASVSAAKKRTEDARRRQQYGVLPPDLNPLGYAPPIPQAQLGRAVAKAQKKQQKQRGRGQQAARQQGAVQAPPLPRRAPAQQEQHAPTTVGPSPSAAVQPSRIARLARRPDSLRAAFILSEVLAPPKSLRDESGHVV